MNKKLAYTGRILLPAMLIVLTVLSGAGLLPPAHAQDPDAAYREALALIQEAKDNSATELDLRLWGLSTTTGFMLEVPR